MVKPNHSIAAELERQQEAWLAAIDEGYAANVNEVPAFLFQPIAYMSMTIAQRGYIWGRELKLCELRETEG